MKLFIAVCLVALVGCKEKEFTETGDSSWHPVDTIICSNCDSSLYWNKTDSIVKKNNRTYVYVTDTLRKPNRVQPGQYWDGGPGPLPTWQSADSTKK